MHLKDLETQTHLVTKDLPEPQMECATVDIHVLGIKVMTLHQLDYPDDAFAHLVKTTMEDLETKVEEKLEQLGYRWMPPQAGARLSRREYDVLKSIAAGNTYEQTATLYGISVNTVRHHIRNLYKKLKVTTAVEARELLNGGDVLAPVDDGGAA